MEGEGTRQKGSKPHGGDHLHHDTRAEAARAQTQGDGPWWCPEPQGGEINVSVPEMGAAPDS